MASATTTEPVVVRQFSGTLFQPAGRLRVPRVLHRLPLSCWFIPAVAKWVPAEVEKPGRGFPLDSRPLYWRTYEKFSTI
jgi:hypothetical protein